MRNYGRLLTIFYKNTLISEMEYRPNFWANIGLSLFWLAAVAVGLAAILFLLASALWRFALHYYTGASS